DHDILSPAAPDLKSPRLRQADTHRTQGKQMTATPQTAEPKSASPQPATPAGRADETAWLRRNWGDARRVRHCDLSHPATLLCCGATLFTPARHRSSATARATDHSGCGLHHE